MVRFTKGPEFDDNEPAILELDGHHRGFKVGVLRSKLNSGEDGYVVHLTSYAGSYFDVQVGTDADPDYTTVEDMVEDGEKTTKDKLSRLITWALGKLDNAEMLKVFSLMYKAGKAAGKNEVRKRFNQVMAIQ